MVFVSVYVEYCDQISTYGINGCRSTCVAASELLNKLFLG